MDQLGLSKGSSRVVDRLTGLNVVLGGSCLASRLLFALAVTCRALSQRVGSSYSSLTSCQPKHSRRPQQQGILRLSTVAARVPVQTHNSCALVFCAVAFWLLFLSSSTPTLSFTFFFTDHLVLPSPRSCALAFLACQPLHIS